MNDGEMKQRRSHAQVFACLADRELVITMLPGNGHVDGGVKWHVPVESVPVACRLPNSLLWVTWQTDRVIIDRFWEPVYSPAEQAAIRRFHAVWKTVVDDTPDPLPPLSQLIGTEPWERLRLGAEDALKIFEVRGRLDEECEAF